MDDIFKKWVINVLFCSKNAYNMTAISSRAESHSTPVSAMHASCSSWATKSTSRGDVGNPFRLNIPPLFESRIV